MVAIVDDTLIGVMIRINNKHWRVSDKTFRYGREWQYTLSHETIDGMYESMRVSESFLDEILREGGTIQITVERNKDLKKNKDWIDKCHPSG